MAQCGHIPGRPHAVIPGTRPLAIGIISSDRSNVWRMAVECVIIGRSFVAVRAMGCGHGAWRPQVFMTGPCPAIIIMININFTPLIGTVMSLNRIDSGRSGVECGGIHSLPVIHRLLYTLSPSPGSVNRSGMGLNVFGVIGPWG